MVLGKIQGYKTYIIAVATVCYALGGAVAGFVPVNEAVYLILGALGLSGLRNGIQQYINNLLPPKQETPQ